MIWVILFFFLYIYILNYFNGNSERSNWGPRLKFVHKSNHTSRYIKSWLKDFLFVIAIALFELCIWIALHVNTVTMIKRQDVFTHKRDELKTIHLFAYLFIVNLSQHLTHWKGIVSNHLNWDIKLHPFD